MTPQSDTPKKLRRTTLYMSDELEASMQQAKQYVPEEHPGSYAALLTFICKRFCDLEAAARITIEGVFEGGKVERRRVRGKWIVPPEHAIGDDVDRPIAVVDEEVKRVAHELGTDPSQLREPSGWFDFYASARSDKGAWIVLVWKSVHRVLLEAPDTFRALPDVRVYNAETELLNAFAERGIRHIAQDLIGSKLQESDWDV